jgi:iron complex outermembrane receptor protein
MASTLRARLFLTISSVVLSVAGSAAAQSSPPASSSSSNSGEIVVTAQKREQTLQQVPVAISAFTALQRDKVGIDSVQDMTNFTPGLSYNTGDDRVTLRGIGRYTNQLSADSSVGVYEDGAFTTFTVKVGQDSLFTDRVEVLRGPQGTLYGRNSIGGAINIISRQPTDTLQGEVRGTVDNYGYHVTEGAVSGPLTDHMQYRLAGSWIGQEGGYFHNLNGLGDEGNKRNEWYGEAQLRGDWGPHFDWWAKGFAGSWQNNGGNAGGLISNSVVVGPDGKTALPAASAFYALNTRPSALGIPGQQVETTDSLAPSLGGFLAPGVTNLQTVNPNGTNPGNADIRNYYSLHPQTQDVQNYMGIALHLTGHFNGFDLRYIGAANHYDYIEQEEWGEGQQLATGVISYTNPSGFVIHPDTELFYAEHHWFSQNEFDILSNGKGPFQWVVGAYNFNEGYKQPEQVYEPGQTQLATPLRPCLILGTCGPTPAFANPHLNLTDGEASMGAETFAGFTQLDWNITKTIKLTGGLRYTYDSKWGVDGAQEYTYLPVQGVPVNAAITLIDPALGTVPGAQPHATAATYNATNGLYERKLSADWHGTTGTAGIQWEPDRDTNVYLKYSRGYKSGGFNAGSLLATNPETNPEHSNDYQFGIKKSLFERTLQLNVDLFYDQYYDAQVPIAQSGTSVASAVFYNLPEARTDGVEIEAVWTPTKALQVMLDYGYNDTDIIKSGCVVDANDPTAVLVGAKPGGCTAGGQNLHGNQLPNAPKNKVALNANYTIDVPTGSLTMSGSYIWRDAQYGSIFNGPQYEAPSWSQVDLRVEYKPSGGRWTVIAYGKNIFNSTGYINGAGAVSQSNGTFLKQYGLTPPAIGGLEVQFKF